MITVISSFLTVYPIIAFADSPSFGHQELGDLLFDIINTNTCLLDTKTKDSTKCAAATQGNRPVDILTVDYHSNGRHLNSTLWLRSKMQEVSFGYSDIPAFGIYIDADSNEKTGWQGIDYQLEIAWNKTEWIKVLNQSSTAGNTRILRAETINYNEFVEKGNQYILLSLDLTAIGSPNNYKIMFYAEDRKNDNSIWKTDFTSWIDIPKPKLKLSTIPDPIELRPSDNVDIDAQIESNNGLIPEVNNFIVPENQTTLDVKYISDKLQTYNREPHSFVVKVPENAATGKYMVSVLANISQKSTIPILSDKQYLNIGERLEELNLPVTVLKPFSGLEVFINFWNTWSSPLSFVTGLLTGKIGPWILVKIRKNLEVLFKKLTGNR
jgi:hypothetical protein